MEPGIIARTTVLLAMISITEQVVGKLTALMGRDTGFGTCGIPFTHIDRLKGVCESLHAAGYSRMGREAMYSGIVFLVKHKKTNIWLVDTRNTDAITGGRLDGNVFIGCVYYQRLRHMVQDKFHARITPWLMFFLVFDVCICAKAWHKHWVP